ncbi:helix-turn-helix transcriptional regulator [Streptomyces olivaceoviridis]|uniref:helix-turn-helix transcriptional regulator n=1 Tax=Streptomyces olivaceoviridis TaxID=1921 RepID=UPI0036C75343
MHRFRRTYDSGGADDRRLPLRGREEEMRFLRARFEALLRGHGGVVHLEGPSGSGKTRLLAEARAVALQRGIRVFQASADPDDQFVPLGPVLDGVSTGGGALFDTDRLRGLAAAPEQRFWLLQELQDGLERAALDTPLLITVDDGQWLDDMTLLALRVLPARLADHRILWIVAARSGIQAPAVSSVLEHLKKSGARHLRLNALTDEDVAGVTEDVLGAPPDAGTLRAVRRAQGVPLLLIELLRGLRDEHAVIVENDRARITTDRLPASFHASVRQRIDQLGAPARDVVRTASAVGRSVTVGLLAELLERPLAALIAPVQELLDTDLLFEEDDRLHFRHDLIREAVESGLPSSVRTALRRCAADALLKRNAPLTEVAALLVDSAEPGDQAAVRLLRTAAQELAATSPASAVHLSRRALALTAEDDPERSALLAETVLLLWQTGQPAQARQLAATALPGELEPEAEARLRLGLARVSSQYSFAEAAEQAGVGAALAGIPDTLRAELLALRCLNLSMMGDLDATATVVAETLKVAARAHNRTAWATATAVESVVRFYELDWESAFARANQAAAVAADVGINHSLWVPEALWKAFLLNAAGRSPEALAESQAGIREAQRQGQAAATYLWTTIRARALLDAGRLEDAQVEAEAAATMFDDLSTGNFADTTLLYALGRAAVYRNDLEAARRYAKEAERMLDDSAILVRNSGSWLIALVADAEGRPHEAMRVLDEAVGTFDEAGPSLATPDDPADLPVFVRMALRAGTVERAAAAVRIAVHRAAVGSRFPILPAAAAHARGLFDNDLSLLLRAVDLYQDIPRLLPRASALEDAGRKLLPIRTVDAVPYLDRALDLYTEAGAEREAARVRRRLRAAGAPRRRTTSRGTVKGWPELTVSEVTVIRLVAQGLTNRQVAQRLDNSPHTVNTHLRHAFTKLGTTSRAELTELVRAREHAE